MMAVAIEEPNASTSKQRTSGALSRQELAGILEQHRKWLESHGAEGQRADLSGAQLEGADLTGANLQSAVLHKTNLRGADLFMAELQGASLTQANLRETNLLGTQLRRASLQGADLAGATGLLVGQLAGANLFEAALPEPVSQFEGLQHVRRVSQNVARALAMVLVVCALACWRIATTSDIQLVKNSPVLGIPRVGEAIPVVEFFLLTPLLLFGLFVSFFWYMQRLWEGVAELPAVFPDGRSLEHAGPRIVMALARHHLKLPGENRASPTWLEVGICFLLTYWIVPITLVVFWARYLTRQDLRGSMLHVSIVVIAIASVTFLPDLIASRLRPDSSQLQASSWSALRSIIYRRAAIALAMGLLLSLLSVGTIHGVPHDTGRAPELKPTDIRRWAANAFWVVGYDPFANLTELDISIRPANWTGREEELSLVQGARLNQLRLRYATAYRTFFANAHLWRANLENLDLSEADLRRANLRQAILRAADLDRARLNRVELEGADLRKANLSGSDLREANLAHAQLAEALLVDTKLGAANLYRANLGAAWLLRADLGKVDLREANLENARLAYADLREADLWSAKLSGAQLREAQLGHAILIEADLRRADLRGANLQGAILRGADLSTANLAGADLLGAVGLTARQVCSAVGKREVKLEENILVEVERECGSVR